MGDPIADGLMRAGRPAMRAGSRALCLAGTWPARSPGYRRAKLALIEADLAQAHSLSKSVIAVARHRREA